jgi:hypothetical protein
MSQGIGSSVIGELAQSIDNIMPQAVQISVTERPAFSFAA